MRGARDTRKDGTCIIRWITLLVLICGLSAELAMTQQTETLTGWFHIIWYDGPPGSGIKGEQYWLDTDQGQSYKLLIDERLFQPFGGALALNRQRVKVTVEAIPATPGPIRVLSIEPEKVIEPQAHLTGSQPWVNLLCKFSDISAEPQPLSYFNGLMSNTYPGMDHYWREISYNTINIVGSASQNWKTLPQPRSYYVYNMDADPELEADLTRLFNDCTALHDGDVSFPTFVGINLMFNDLLDCCAWGGSRTATLDGETKTYRVTWEPPWGYENQGVIAHEMGHGWGWPHSSGAYGATYDSRWDVMSDIWGNCPPYHSTYGCVGQGTISYHKDLAHWIGAGRTFVPTLNTITTINIERLNQPVSPTDYLMARIPISSSPLRYYTVEARRFVGYDGNLPGEAIIIHHVEPARLNDAWVVDADGDMDGDCDGADSNCNPDDAGARWTPGETFTDATNSIQVRVNSSTATGFSVTITYGNPPLCTSTGALFRVERTTGNACADGSWNSGGADVAEFISASETLQPGDLVELDPHKPKSYRKTQKSYSPLVAGVISTKPGLVLGLKLSEGVDPHPRPLPERERGELSLSLARLGEGRLLLSGVSISRLATQTQSERPLLALLGRVPVRATTENGPIRVGDLLTSSSKPGYAMRCENAQRCEGAIIGKALQPLEAGEGLILVLLMR